MSYFVHALELVTAVLFVVLAVQLKRCYQFEQNRIVKTDAQIETQPKQDEIITVEKSLTSLLPEVETTLPETQEALSVEAAEPVISETPSAANKPSNILTDYIGEFFETASEPALNIEAYKAPVMEKVIEVKTDSVQADAIASEFADSEESLDDIITVVEQEDQNAGKVMSEKVVHAMLDEAKMVCAS